MTLYTSRPYAGDSDYVAMRDLVIDSCRESGSPIYATAGDLEWWMSTHTENRTIERVELWFDPEGVLAGFAWPTRDQIDLLVHPKHKALERIVLDWEEKRFATSLGELVASQSFTAWSFDGDHTRNATLRQAGYQPTDDVLRCNLRTQDDVPPVKVPTPYRLGDMATETDIEQRVAVHRDAFAPSRMTVEKHRRVMRATLYRAELDIVIVANDGTFAAYCIVWFDAANRMGTFEPVGCHSSHRRRGLGATVMAEGLRRLAGLGATTALVNSYESNLASCRLYETSGFAVADRNRAWTKQLCCRSS